MKRAQEQKIDIRKPAERPLNASDKKGLVNSLDVEDKIELERREAYIEPQTRDLLRKLLQEGDKKELIPVYTPGIGFVYQITCSSSGKTETDQLSRDCLENLVELDILHKSFYEVCLV